MKKAFALDFKSWLTWSAIISGITTAVLIAWSAFSFGFQMRLPITIALATYILFLFGVAYVLRDFAISRERRQETLRSELERISTILQASDLGTWEWNVQTGALRFNERWAAIVGYTLKDLAPSINTWTELAHPDDVATSDNLLTKHFSRDSEYYECEARMRHKSGHWVWVLDRGRVSTWTSEGEPLLMSGTHQEITERKEKEEKIRHMANHDALTNLPNLALAMDRITVALAIARRKSAPAAVLFIDLDGFKQVNDSHGHDAGDAVLREIANRFVTCVRETDTVARIGGDEFLVIATELQRFENASIIAQKTLESAVLPIDYEGKRLKVGASIGVAVSADDGDSPQRLVKSADTAMYSVKRTGKNGVAFASREHAGYGARRLDA